MCLNYGGSGDLVTLENVDSENFIGGWGLVFLVLGFIES